MSAEGRAESWLERKLPALTATYDDKKARPCIITDGNGHVVAKMAVPAWALFQSMLDDVPVISRAYLTLKDRHELMTCGALSTTGEIVSSPSATKEETLSPMHVAGRTQEWRERRAAGVRFRVQAERRDGVED